MTVCVHFLFSPFFWGKCFVIINSQLNIKFGQVEKEFEVFLKKKRKAKKKQKKQNKTKKKTATKTQPDLRKYFLKYDRQGNLTKYVLDYAMLCINKAQQRNGRKTAPPSSRRKVITESQRTTTA